MLALPLPLLVRWAFDAGAAAECPHVPTHSTARRRYIFFRGLLFQVIFHFSSDSRFDNFVYFT